MRKIVLGVTALLLFLVGSAKASILVSTTSQATPGLAGYRTWTVTLSTDVDLLSTVDAKFNSAVMNQVNPFGVLATIFQDNNAAFPSVPANVLQDSQFSFNSTTEALLVVPAPTTLESSTQLSSAFTGFTPFVSRAIAQIVIPTTEVATYDITGVTRDNTEYRLQGTISAVPEPSSIVLAGLGIVGLLFWRRRSREGVFCCWQLLRRPSSSNPRMGGIFNFGQRIVGSR